MGAARTQRVLRRALVLPAPRALFERRRPHRHRALGLCAAPWGVDRVDRVAARVDVDRGHKEQVGELIGVVRQKRGLLIGDKQVYGALGRGFHQSVSARDVLFILALRQQRIDIGAELQQVAHVLGGRRIFPCFIRRHPALLEDGRNAVVSRRVRHAAVAVPVDVFGKVRQDRRKYARHGVQNAIEHRNNDAAVRTASVQRVFDNIEIQRRERRSHELVKPARHCVKRTAYLWQSRNTRTPRDTHDQEHGARVARTGRAA